MRNSVARLLATRDQIEAKIRTRFAGNWQVLQEEIGIPQDLRSSEPPARVELDGTQVAFTVPARVPASTWQAERRAQMRIAIPAEGFDRDPSVLRTMLQREWPLRCSWCGLAHRVGIARCTSSGNCWGALYWRPESPRPLFYVERAGTFGYFPQGPQPRGLRYAIDLSDNSLFGIQTTLRHRDRWINPVPETIRTVVARITASVATDLACALDGEVTTHSNPACFSFTGPDWCREPNAKLPIHVRRSNRRLLIA